MKKLILLSAFAALFLFALVSCEKKENANLDTLGNVQKENTEKNCYANPDDKYEYTVVPGMKQWQELASIDEAFEICQLPDDVLKSISTKGLIDALVHSPMFTGHYLLSSSSPVATWHRLYSKLNSAKELFNRENSGDILVEYYKEIDLSCINQSYNEIEKVTELERLFGIEFLFTKPEILKKISTQNKQELVKYLLKNYENNTNNYFTVIAIASVLYNDNYTPLVEYYKKNTNLYEMNILVGYFLDDNQRSEIISFAKLFIM